MRIIAALVLVFGLALAAGAVFFASEYYNELKASMAQRTQGPETVKVLVAKQALGYGTTLQPGNLQWVEWPATAVPPCAFTSVDDLLGTAGERRIVLRSLEPGEPILRGKITKFGESPRMSMNLNPGMRAVSIKIDAVSGVAGFVAAGDRVDILLTRTQQGQLVSSVILQDITIIAVDQSANSETIRARLGSTVTVEVSTVQAQKLALARQLGKLSLTLRGIIGETDEETLKPMMEDSLSDFETNEEAAKPKIRVRRGGVLSAVDVDEVTEPADAAGDAAAGN